MIREFILKDRIFSRCSALQQSQIMNELDCFEDMQEAYGILVLELKQEREKNNQLLFKYRQLEFKFNLLKEKEEKQYRNQPW